MIHSRVYLAVSGHHSLLPVQLFAPVPNVTTTNRTAADLWLLVPAYRTAKSITLCWTEFCMKNRYSSPVSLFYIFHFYQQGQPRAHLHHSLPGEHTRGCFRRADPQLQSLCGSLGQTHRSTAQLPHRQINFVQVHPNQFKLQFLLWIALEQTFHRSICLLGGPAEGRNVAVVFYFLKSPPSLILDTHFCMRQGKKEGKAQPAQAGYGSEAQPH